jgi:hypothetical protein
VKVKVNPLVKYLCRVYAKITLPTCCLINKNVVTGACQYVLLQASKAIFDLDGETDVDGIDLIRKTWGEVRTNPGPLTGENVFYGIECDLLLEMWPCGGLWIPRPTISDFSQSFIVVSDAGRVSRPIKDLHGRMNEVIDG